MEHQDNRFAINESTSHAEAVRERNRIRARERRQAMTTEEREAYLARRRERYHARRNENSNQQNENVTDLNSRTFNQIERVRVRDRLRQAELLQSMTPEQRMSHLARRRLNYRLRNQQPPSAGQRHEFATNSRPESSTSTSDPTIPIGKQEESVTNSCLQPSISTLNTNKDGNEATGVIHTCTLVPLSHNPFSNINSANYFEGSTSYTYVPHIEDNETDVHILDHPVRTHNFVDNPRPPSTNTHYNIARDFSERQGFRPYKLPPHRTCPNCFSILFSGESKNLCCNKGSISLPAIPVHTELWELFTADTTEARMFRRDLRMYNHVFSFTSMGVDLDESVNNGRGVFTFRAHGSIYHKIGSLLPTPGQRPRFIQMYIYDTDNETEYRMLENTRLNRGLIQKLQRILNECNPFVRMFRQLSMREDLLQCKLLIKERPTSDRQYTLPTVSEVAAIIPVDDENVVATNRDIIVQTIGGHLIQIKEFYGYYDPLQYPLFLSRGTYGWDSTRRNVNNAKISCSDYYAYMLQIRPTIPSILLYGGRLLQQYIVDNYVKIETQRLRFVRANQDKLRAKLYHGLQDCLYQGENNAGNVGRRTILPPSFTGSPRDMYQRYQDAMAIVRTFGKPDLFITMTCNPNWIEIQERLYPGQTPQDRPDLLSRIFRAKYEELKKDIYTRGVLGYTVAHVHVVEFQKRGLPHVHMLVIFDDNNKINTADLYDQIVRAEIPNQEEEPLLYEAVLKHMIHGPCGLMNPNAPCMNSTGCKKKYPKQFAESTMQGNDSYPVYRRRNNNRNIPLDRNGEKVVDNRWVVPYNAWLLLKYDCHINVEICSSIKSIKYLYKYVYKGPDCAAMEVRSGANNDEVKRFVDGRYICAPEALWKIFKFPITRMYPSVERLQLHLPNMHSVPFNRHDRISDILNEPRNTQTMLTEFFKVHSEGRDPRKYLYSEFPMYYRWISTTKVWQKRVSAQKVIGRIYAASPTEGERFYLRILLNHVRGPKSFEDLRTVAGVLYSTFKQAAEKLGLLYEDDSLRQCMIEARTTRMPDALRRLFAIILIFCQPTEVRKLWDENYEYMIEDYTCANTVNPDYAVNKLLHNINDILLQHGKDVKDFDLPRIVETFPRPADRSTLIEDELSLPISPFDLESVTKLNVGQLDAFNKIKEAILENQSKQFFIDGPAGTGKTFLYRALLAYFRQEGRIMIATATSGIAATQLPGARTAHSTLKIPLKLDSASMCYISKQSELCELIRNATAIIWDEAPMANKKAIETVDRTFRDILGVDLPFGGKIMIFGGDFRQVVPVVVGGTRTQSVQSSIVHSHLWPGFIILQLTENIRAHGDQTFSNFVLRVGNGEEPTVEDDMIIVPDSMVIQSEDDQAIQQLISAIFPDMSSHICDPEYMMQRSIITPRNDEVNKLNDMIIAAFPGENETSFYSYDSVEEDPHNLFLPEFLNSLAPGNMPPHKLTLKKGSQIMLLRNIDPKLGLCNGTRLLCHTFGRNYIDAEILTGESKGRRVFLPRIPMQTSEDAKLPFLMTRRQFPVRLSFAMTINKSKGQTIPNVGIYLPDHVFSHGQLYVAVSRGVSQTATKFLIKQGKITDHEGTYTRNVVYPEIFSRLQHT